MKLQSLILCEDVRKEIRGTHTIVGQFNALRGYVGETYSFKCFFTITDHIGNAKLNVVIRSPEKVEIKRFLTDDIPCISRQDHYAGYFTINNLMLRSYGRYDISISDRDGNELGNIGINYLIPNFTTNTLMIDGKTIEVPRVNYHNDKELQAYAKLFLRKSEPLKKPFVSVEFHSQFNDSDGIGGVSILLIEEMIKRGIKVRPVPIFKEHHSQNFIKRLSKNNLCRGESDVTILNSLPPHIKNVSTAKRLLLFTYWEADRVDKSWVNVSNRADALFVPSQYVKDVYKNSGVTKPILVYKQPVSPLFQYADKLKEEGEEKCFDILFLGSCIPRKGVDLFCRAVDKVFGDDKSVRIRMHVKPWSEALGDQRRWLSSKYKDNNRYFITQNTMTVAEIVRLIQSVDLLVAPSRSEGLGLIPIQSVICGTPAIVPLHSGFLEYANTPGFIGLSKHEKVKGDGIYESGYWFEPSFTELCESLKSAKENRVSLFKEAQKGSEVLREAYSVSSTYSSLETLINNIYVK